MVLLLRVMEVMSSTSQKAAAYVISVYCGGPRVGLRLGILHKSCRGHCPQRTCSVPCFPVVGPTCNNHQISGAFPLTAAPSCHHHPCVTAALLYTHPPSCLLYTLLSRTGKQGRVHSNSSGWSSDPSCTLGITPAIPSLSPSVDMVRLNSPGE